MEQTIKRAVKTADCEHEYVWDLKRRFAIHPATVKGVCKKCGAKIEVPRRQLIENLRNAD